LEVETVARQFICDTSLFPNHRDCYTDCLSPCSRYAGHQPSVTFCYTVSPHWAMQSNVAAKLVTKPLMSGIVQEVKTEVGSECTAQ